MAPIIPHLLYCCTNIYNYYRVKIKALIDAKGSGSIQQCVAFSQGSLCVKSIIHFVTVSGTPGFCLCIHTASHIASRETLGEIHSFYLLKSEEEQKS